MESPSSGPLVQVSSGARAPSDGWNGPSAVTGPAQPWTDNAIQNKFTKSRENTETITSLKKGSRCHKTQKQKTHLKPNRPHPKMFPHVHPLFKAKSMWLRQQRAERPCVVFSAVVSLRKQAAAWTAPGPFAVAVLHGGGACPWNCGE